MLDTVCGNLRLNRRRFSVNEVARMLETSVLQEGSRFELIDGELIEMAAAGSRHAGMVKRLNRRLFQAVGSRAVVAVQDPVQLDAYSQPEPDLALLRPRADDYFRAHPTAAEVLLLVEVADSSLPYDLTVKLPLYAHAGIAELWLVDLPGRTLTVYRHPAGSSFAEQHTTIAADLDEFRLTCLPGVVVPLAGLFDTPESP